MRSIFKGLVTCAAAGAVILNASTSLAAIDKCQAELQKVTNLLRSKAMTSFQKCADAVRKENAKEELAPGTGKPATAANTCQKELAKIFDVVTGAKTERVKFYEKVDKAFLGTTPKCLPADLQRLGHMVSGTQAPGTLPQDFAKTYLAVQAIRGAQNEMTAQTRDFINLITAAKTAPNNPTGTGVANTATDCDLPPTCNYKTDLGCRPDLCDFDIQCRLHSCTLDNSGAPPGESFSQVDLAAVPLSPFSLIGRSSFEFCTLEDENYPIGDGGEGYLIMGGPTRALQSVQVLTSTICVDTIAAEGFCAASGDFLGKAENLLLCQDRVLSDGDSCGLGGISTGVGESHETSCFCDLGSGVLGAPCSATDAPCAVGTCGLTDTGTPCFYDTDVSPVRLYAAGATTAGDCVVLNSTSFTTLGSSGDCDDGGPSSNPDSFGPDCVPCTIDDVAAPAAVATTPFTTGTAQAQLKDAANTVGACNLNGNHNCIEDANCPTSGGPDTCSGQVLLDIATGVLAGSPMGTLTNFETSNLSGLTLVGAFPASASATGDLVTAFRTKCQ